MFLFYYITFTNFFANILKNSTLIESYLFFLYLQNFCHATMIITFNSINRSSWFGLFSSLMEVKMIVCWNAQDDKMPKYDIMPKVKMPIWHLAQVGQNAQGVKMPKRHYAHDDNMSNMTFCPRWKNAQIVIFQNTSFDFDAFKNIILKNLIN